MTTAATITYRIYYKNLSKITAKERRILNSLTLRPSSGMRDDVLSKRKDLDLYEIFLAKQEVKIIGWAVLFPENLSDCGSIEYCSYVYVRYANRRCGVGTRLLKRVLKKAKELKVKVKVFPWDGRSDKFFETGNLNVEIEYDH